MAMKLDARQAAELLKQQEEILILTHKSPDGDTLGTGYALYYALTAMRKQASVACSDPIPEKYGYFAKPVLPLTGEPGFIVAVDVADTQLLGPALEQYAGKVDLCIDHHVSNTLYADKVCLYKTASAACEIMAEVIAHLGTDLTPMIASCLYTGMATDTGCFKFSNTTAHTHRMAAQMIEAGADYVQINRIMFDTKSKSRVLLEQAALSGMEFFFDDRCAVITVTQELFVRSGAQEADLDGVSALSRQIEGVEVGVFLREKEDGSFKVSVRTTSQVNASELCKIFGGGGHVRAAGCVLSGPLEQAKQTLLCEVKRALEEIHP